MLTLRGLIVSVALVTAWSGLASATWASRDQGSQSSLSPRPSPDPGQRDKSTLTAAQKKLTSDLLAAIRAHAEGAAPAEAIPRRSSLDVDAKGRVLVDLQVEAVAVVEQRIVALKGEVMSAFPRYQAIRARVPLGEVETLAELEEVKSIRPADLVTNWKGA